MSKTVGLPPTGRADSRILILGTLPSRQSIERQQYYGNPRNAFWPIMSALYQFDKNLPYSARVSALAFQRIALWDVLRSSHRPGSMDAAIDLRSARANNFRSFFATRPGLEAVWFNGRKATELFERLVKPVLPQDRVSLQYGTLPSTSPAYAAMRFASKLEAWSMIRGKDGCRE